MLRRTFVIVMLISVITIAGFGMYVGTKNSGEQMMSHCLFHIASGINSMKLGEHIENWRGSVLGTISFELPLFSSLFLLSLFFISFFLIDSYKVKFVQLTQDIRGEPPKLSNFLNLLFANGILHPKIF